MKVKLFLLPLLLNGFLFSFSQTNTFPGSGNVGIGTTSPSAKLHVSSPAGHADAWLMTGSGANQYATMLFGEGVTAGNYAEFIRYSNASSVGFHPGDFVVANLNKKIVFSTSYSGGYRTDLVVNSAGNVGIGTNNPGQYKLAVEGIIGARKLKVLQTSWADYVFDSTYRLPTLKEVEQYIKEHKHLPDVPSAKDVQENGLDVGENQAILLKKIEELTLYVIELKKEIEQLKKKADSGNH